MSLYFPPSANPLQTGSFTRRSKTYSVDIGFKTLKNPVAYTTDILTKAVGTTFGKTYKTDFDIKTLGNIKNYTTDASIVNQFGLLKTYKTDFSTVNRTQTKTYKIDTNIVNQFGLKRTSQTDMSIVNPAASVFPTHVVHIVMENTSLSSALGASPGFQNKLFHGNFFPASGSTWQGGLCTNYLDLSLGQSFGNYVILACGSNFGVTSDNAGVFPFSFECKYSGNSGVTYPLPHLIDKFIQFSITYNIWAESANPSSRSWTCHGTFNQNVFDPPRASDHCAWLAFATNGPANGDRIAPFCKSTTAQNPPTPTCDPELISLLNGPGPYPNYIWLTPNDNSNGHDTGANFADNYLANLVPRILNSTMFKSYPSIRPALVVVYDEGSGGTILCGWAGPIIVNGRQDTVQYKHHNLCATIEKIFGLGNMGRNDAGAATMDAFFHT